MLVKSIVAQRGGRHRRAKLVAYVYSNASLCVSNNVITGENQVHATKQLSSDSLLAQTMACILCEVVYTNLSHDDEFALLRVKVLHPLLKWW
jgi:hypothetical protein